MQSDGKRVYRDVPRGPCSHTSSTWLAVGLMTTSVTVTGTVTLPCSPGPHPLGNPPGSPEGVGRHHVPSGILSASGPDR